MKSALIATGLAALMLMGCSPEPLKLTPEQERMVKLFQSDEEPTAKDAVWTARDIFKVGVFDDGTRRDGYAGYVCEKLYQNGFKGKGIWVQIIDIARLTRDDWVILGDVRCDDWMKS